MKFGRRLRTLPRRIVVSVSARRWRAAPPFGDLGELPPDVRLPFHFLGTCSVLLVVFIWFAGAYTPPPKTPPGPLPPTIRLVLVIALVAFFEGGRRLLFRYMIRRLRNPGVVKETKTSVENFRNLSYVLTTAGGASLVLKLDGVFDVFVMLNVMVGFWYMDFLRPLYGAEQSEDSVSYLVVNRAYAHALSHFVRTQVVLVALALFWLISGRWSV